MISEITSITESLKNHLFSMKDEFYLGYHDMRLVVRQVHHYFCNSFDYYRQYSNSLNVTVNTKKDEMLLKTCEIALMASTFYLIFHNSKESSYEQRRCRELETLTMKSVCEKFYKDTLFAMDLISGFLQSDFFSEEEINQKKELLSPSENKTIFKLYPVHIVDEGIRNYQKSKKREN